MKCRVCGVSWQDRIHHLSEPADVYAAWMDEAAEQKIKNGELEKMEAGGGRGRGEERSYEDSDPGFWGPLGRTPPGSTPEPNVAKHCSGTRGLNLEALRSQFGASERGARKWIYGRETAVVLRVYGGLPK